MTHPLKKSEHKRQEPKLGEPRLVHSDGAVEIPIAQELIGERVADTLIRARQQLGQDLRSIAEVLCIRYSYLDALERGQYENLPGPTYAVGFMRSYADYLGLDGEQIVERFKNEVEGLDSQTKLHFPTPAPEGKMPGGAVFLVAALLFAGAYGVWFYLSNQGETLGDLVAPVPEQLQDMVGGATSVQPAAPAPAAPSAALGAPSQAGQPAAASQAPTAFRQGPVQPATTAPEDPAAAATPAAHGAADLGAADGAATAPQAAALPQSPDSGTAAPAADGAAAASQAGATAQQTTATAGRQAALPESESPASDPQASEPQGSGPAAPAELAAADSQAPADTGETNPSYAIPAAPGGNASAADFLRNHQPTVYGEENADARIVLTAHQDAWVQVRDREGNLLLTRVLRVGDSYRVPNEADLTLLTGNAGGLEIAVDGSTLPALGPVGAVRRNIPLDPEALRSGAGRQP